MNEPRYPTNKDDLLREISARIKIKDIKSRYNLRDMVEVKWWEAGLRLLLFGSTLCFLGFVILLIARPEMPGRPVVEFTLMLLFLPLVLSILLIQEFMFSKIAALRRIVEIMLQLLEENQTRISEIERAEAKEEQDIEK